MIAEKANWDPGKQVAEPWIGLENRRKISHCSPPFYLVNV
jgi:hypothetical protein